MGGVKIKKEIKNKINKADGIFIAIVGGILLVLSLFVPPIRPDVSRFESAPTILIIIIGCILILIGTLIAKQAKEWG